MSPFNYLGSTEEQEDDYMYTQPPINKTQRRSGRRRSQPSYKKNLHKELTKLFLLTLSIVYSSIVSCEQQTTSTPIMISRRLLSILNEELNFTQIYYTGCP